MTSRLPNSALDHGDLVTKKAPTFPAGGRRDLSGVLSYRGSVGSAAKAIRGAATGSRKEKPRRVTGLSVMVGPQGHSIQAPPVHVRGPTRPNWGGGTSRVCPFHNTA